MLPPSHVPKDARVKGSDSAAVNPRYVCAEDCTTADEVRDERVEHPTTRKHSNSSRRKPAQEVRDDRIERAVCAAGKHAGQFVGDKGKRRNRTSCQRVPSYLPVPLDYPWGKKRWLKRREITWEYGPCSRTIRRAEIRGHLNPTVLFGDYLYRRDEIERALEHNRLRIAAPADDQLRSTSSSSVRN